MDFLATLERSGISVWLRTSDSLLAYPLVLSLHTLGLGVVFGFTAVVDSAILGFVPRMPIERLQGLFPVIWSGFWINAVSGVALLLAEPTRKVVNPMLWTKLILIGLALMVMRLIRNQCFRDPRLGKSPVGLNGRLLAFISLVLWMGAITAGRMMAYVEAGF